ncbi:hypothetical protein LEP1GSC179_0890 [Leptospira santarosai str. MOR084]|uniref:Uncharacterized protein n=1 Tax=Leptospira santarosai str. MOR084 TaxID=1049984 RepID=A0A0E2BA35_9LEPT|nr:hypothetical protein LEP1GSC179_0890 [Leptospira santarosai str. MOR084]
MGRALKRSTLRGFVYKKFGNNGSFANRIRCSRFLLKPVGLQFAAAIASVSLVK